MSAFFALAEIGKISVPPFVCLPLPTQPNTLPDGTLQVFYVSRMWRFDPDYVELTGDTLVEIYHFGRDVYIMAVPGASMGIPTFSQRAEYVM